MKMRLKSSTNTTELRVHLSFDRVRGIDPRNGVSKIMRVNLCTYRRMEYSRRTVAGHFCYPEESKCGYWVLYRLVAFKQVFEGLGCFSTQETNNVRKRGVLKRPKLAWDCLVSLC